jgi:DNA mismatch repair ATPase MutS
LFGFLNHTATACGARLLRTNLLQPLTDITTLELRLDSLQVRCNEHAWCRTAASMAHVD